MGAPKFTWGDSVRVKPGAPAEMHGGERGDVVAVTEIDTQEKADAYGVPVGSTTYQVEFGDGGVVEIEEAWLEAAKE